MCSRCNAAYIGKTKRHLKLRFRYLSLHPKKGTMQAGQSIAILKHTLFYGCLPLFEDFDVLARDSNELRVTLKDSF